MPTMMMASAATPLMMVAMTLFLLSFMTLPFL
jgi:hypothetical protein